MPSYKYSFKLVSADNQIAFPTLNDNIRKIKIKKLMYRVINQNQQTFNIKILGLDDNKHYFGDGTTENYTLMIYNVNGINTLVNYVNDSTNWDIYYEYGNIITTLYLQVYINGVLTPDITVSNPLYIELELSSEK
jgi:hypothetical protein